MAIRIRLATSAAEREAVYAFRYRVYVEEMGKPMAEADHVKGQVHDAPDDRGLLFAAFDGDDLVGTLRLNLGRGAMAGDLHMAIYNLELFDDVDPAQLAFASRFMLRRDYRGSMAAHRLSLAALEAALEADVRLCYCYCAPYLVSFYEQMGFRRYTNNFNDVLGYRVPMLMVLFDSDHLKGVRSPLADRMPSTPEGEDWAEYFGDRFPEFDFPVNSRLLSTEEFYQLLNYKLHDDPLQTIPLLRDLTKEEADVVLEAGTIIPCVAGDSLMRAGEHSSEIYLILSAMVGVRAAQSEKLVGILGPGDLLGEMAFLMSSTRTADVVVMRDGELLVLSEHVIQQLIKHRPHIASKLFFNLSRILCERLAATTRNLGLRLELDKSPLEEQAITISAE